MKIGIRDDCRHCSAPIALCCIRGGQWVPFDAAMVELTPDAVDAYLPVRTARSVALVPIGEISDQRLAGIRWVAQRHRCAPYLLDKAAAYQAHLAKREHVTDLQPVIEQWIREST